MPSVKSLMIIFDVKHASESHSKAIFANPFHNEETDVHALCQVEGRTRLLSMASRAYGAFTL